MAAERQADEEVRAAANSALLAQQQQTREMHEAAALRLHAVTEEHAFAKATFDQADQADAALAALNVVQQKSELGMMKRRCEQAQDLLQQDQRAIDGTVAAHADDVAQMRASFQEQETRLASQQVSFQEQEAAFAVQAQAAKHAYQTEMSERAQHVEQDTVVRCLAMEHEVDRACQSEVESLRTVEAVLSAEHESESARLSEERTHLAEENPFSTSRN